jgi:ubiquinone/menaquinone biosynthesis C-methylase UbiE
MTPDMYRCLDNVDNRHWFYQARRAIARHWIKRYYNLTSTDLLVDAGMGTGVWLAEMGHTCRTLGIDNHEESLAYALPRLATVGSLVMKASLTRVDLPDGCASVITIMDVLEHIEDDRAALREMARIMRPGGLLLITVPAYRWLWSDWDIANQHFRRYSRKEFLQVVNMPELRLLRCQYFNSILMPAIALTRWCRRMSPPRALARVAENRVPAPLINFFLEKLMTVPACCEWLRLPFGVSLLAVLRRTIVKPNISRKVFSLKYAA